MALLWIVIIIIILRLSETTEPWSEIVNMTASGEIYLLLHSLKLYRKVDPDFFPFLTALGVTDVSTIRVVTDADMNTFFRGEPIPKDLLDKQSGTPDDLMRVIQARSILLKPQEWWLESHFLPNIFNPSFVRWHGKILMSWRSMAVKFGWLNINAFAVNETDTYRGIDRFTRIQVKQDADYNKLQDDPRMMILHDNSVLVTYARHVLMYLFYPSHNISSLYTSHNISPTNATYRFLLLLFFFSVYESANRFSIFRFVMNHSTGQAEMCCHKQLTFLGSSGSGSISQKNWIPFEYRNKLLFIQHINPLIVVEAPNWDEASHNDPFSNQTVEVKQLHKLDAVSVPWPYGDLRGGTPALLLEHHGMYLSFFHSKDYAQRPYRQSTYFFGAITFCHAPPFNIVGMSPQPIVNSSLYDGPWLWPSLDYGVYPAGLILDDDKKHVWVAVGHQDRNAYVMKFELHGLLRSLQIVGNCSSKSDST